jgi:hypothetical protein
LIACPAAVGTNAELRIGKLENGDCAIVDATCGDASCAEMRTACP